MKKYKHFQQTNLYCIPKSCALQAVKYATGSTDKDVLKAFIETNWIIGEGTFACDMLLACRLLGFSHEVIFSNGAETAGHDGYIDGTYITWKKLCNNIPLLEGKYIAAMKEHVFFLYLEHGRYFTHSEEVLKDRTRITALYRIFPSTGLFQSLSYDERKQ